MSNNRNASRRKFVKQLAGGALLTSMAPAAWGQTDRHILDLPQREAQNYSPNDTIRVGAIGMGIQGFNNCQSALKTEGVELVAVCDLYDGRLTHCKEMFGNHLRTTKDYREILDSTDIDAVIISTPDHWHDHITIAALKAGKHVYCEKPMVHKLDEGQAVLEAARNSDKVMQVGSQRVSSILFEKARQVYEAGDIGQLVFAEILNDRHSALGAWNYSVPPDASPETIDWERFVGDAPEHEFDKIRFFRWRNYTAYGTGVAGDLYVHFFSGLHKITSSHGPNRILSTGGLRYWDDGRDVPDVIMGAFDYPDTDKMPGFNLQMRTSFIHPDAGNSNTHKLIGTEGVMEIGWTGITIKRNPLPKDPGYGGWDSLRTFSEETQKAFVEEYKQKYPRRYQIKEPNAVSYSTPDGYSDHEDHFWNFFDAIRNGTPVVEDAEFGMRAAGPALATNVSYFENRIVNWDPEGMREV